MDYIVYDLEATCWEGDGDFQRENSEIIEIGAVRVKSVINDLKIKYVIVNEFQTFIQPKKHRILTDYCKDLTSITQKDVNRAPHFKKAYNDFQEWCGKNPFILSSWGHYDYNQLNKDCRLNQIKFKIEFGHLNVSKLFSYFTGTKKCGLKKSLKKFDMEFKGNQHRGIDDARNISRILIRILDGEF